MIETQKGLVVKDERKRDIVFRNVKKAGGKVKAGVAASLKKRSDNSIRAALERIESKLDSLVNKLDQDKKPE